MINQNKQPILLKTPSKRKSNIYPNNSINHPPIPKIMNIKIPKKIIPTISIFVYLLIKYRNYWYKI